MPDAVAAYISRVDRIVEFLRPPFLSVKSILRLTFGPCSLRLHYYPECSSFLLRRKFTVIIKPVVVTILATGAKDICGSIMKGPDCQHTYI